MFLRKYKSKIKMEQTYKIITIFTTKQIKPQKRVSSLKFYATIAFKFKLDKDTQ